MADKPLLEVKDLVIHYETDDGVVKALNGVNIHIGVGETLDWWERPVRERPRWQKEL